MRRRKGKNPETLLQAKVLEALGKIPGLIFWRNSTGRGKALQGGIVQFGKIGSGDILGIVPPHGKFLTIELKMPGEKERPEQITFRKEVVAAGGIAIVADSVQSVLFQFLVATHPEENAAAKRYEKISEGLPFAEEEPTA